MQRNLRIVYFGFLFLIFLIPLGRLPVLFSEIPDYQQLKLIYIVFAVILLVFWLYISAFEEKKISVKKSSVYLPFGLFIVWSVLSLIWTVSLAPTFTQAFFFISYFILFFLIINLATNDKKREMFLWILLASASIVSVYTVHQYFWGLEATREYARIYGVDVPLNAQGSFTSRLNTDRAFGTFLYPNTLATFLIIVFPFPVFYAFFSRGCKRFFPSVVSLFILFAFILTFSKGGAIALLFSWLVLGIVRIRKKYKLISLTVVITLIVSVLFLSFNNNYVAKKTQRLKASGKVRVEYWQAGLEMIKEEPVIGFGLGSFGRVYAKYKLPQAEETQMAHNNFLQVWMELGTVGFLIFLSIFVFYFKDASRNLRKLSSFSPTKKTLILGGYVSVLAFTFHSLTDFSLYIFNAAAIFFVLMGISCGVSSDKKEIANKKGIVIFLLIICFAFIFSLSRPFKAKTHYIQAINSEDLQESINELNLSVNYWSWGEDEYRMGYHYVLSQLYKQRMLLGRKDFTSEIIEHLKYAVDYDKCRSLYWRELAIAYMFRNDVDNALESMKEAVSLYPTNGLNHLVLGDVYISMDRKEEALNEYQTALEYDSSLKDEVNKRIENFE